MSWVKFPKCGHKERYFEIEFVPVTMRARVAMLHGSSNYHLDVIDANPSFSEEALRAFLLDKEKLEQFAGNVKVKCIQCGETCELNELEVMVTCGLCGSESNLEYCPHNETMLCTVCRKTRCRQCNPEKKITKMRKEGY